MLETIRELAWSGQNQEALEQIKGLASEDLDPHETVELARLAEELGYRAVAVDLLNRAVARFPNEHAIVGELEELLNDDMVPDEPHGPDTDKVEREAPPTMDELPLAPAKSDLIRF